jgi:transposase-like protein
MAMVEGRTMASARGGVGGGSEGGPQGRRPDAGREAFWRRLVAGQPTSGRSIRDWCIQHGVSEPSFYAWRKELARRNAAAPRERPAASQHKFVELHHGPTLSGATSSTAIRLFVGDVRIEVDNDFEALALQRVLDVVRAKSNAEAARC